MHHPCKALVSLEREYDIREIDEDLYLALLAHCRS